MKSAQTIYDTRQHPDYYDTRTDAELEEIWAKEAAEKARKSALATYVRDDALWDRVAAKMDAELAMKNAA
jgi:hypothetical protein